MVASNEDQGETTIYIEEIFEEPDHVTLNEEIENEARDSLKNKQSDEIKTETWKYTQLSKCPQVIGGGATLTRVVVEGDNSTKYFSFGGCDRHGNVSGSIHVYDTVSNQWTEHIECTGTPPCPRFGHTAAPHKNYIYIFGGQTLSNSSRSDSNELVSFNDLYRLDTISLFWEKLECSGGDKNAVMPAARNSHTAVIMKGNLIIYGGANSESGPLPDLWEFDLSQHCWKKIICSGGKTPGAREMHSACVYSKERKNIVSLRMYVVGGRKENKEVCQDTWMLDSDNWEWTQLESPKSPRCSHTSGIDLSSNVMYIYGGWNGSDTICNEIMEFSLSSNTWINTMLLDQKHSRRFGHGSAFSSEGSFLILGGVNELYDLNDLWHFQKRE